MAPAHARWREFPRGWRALSAATLGIGFGVAIVPGYTNGLVVNALQTDFGWSRTQLASLPFVGALILVVTAPVVGLLIDRWGVRSASAAGMLVVGLAYLVMSGSGPSFGGYLTLFALMYVLGSPSTAVSFTRVVTTWFDRARGLALGVALSGAGLVAFLIPTVLGDTLQEQWRDGYRVLGLTVLVCAAAVFVLMPRDEAVAAGNDAGARASAPSVGSIRPLLRRRPFPLLAAAFFALSTGVGWVPQLLVVLLRDEGANSGAAARAVSVIGVALIVGRLLVGQFVDRFFAPRVGANTFLLAAAGFATLLVSGPSLGWVVAIATGLVLGAEIDVVANVTSRYWPAACYGRLFGVFYSITQLGTGISPLLVARLHEATGSYTLPLAGAIGLVLLSAALLTTAQRYPTNDAVSVDEDDGAARPARAPASATTNEREEQTP